MIGVILGVGAAFTNAEGIRSIEGSYNKPIRGLSILNHVPAGAKITIDPSKRFQTIIGFGSALTEAAAYNYAQLDAAAKEEVIESLYGSRGIRLTFGRMHIGSADFSLSPYSCVTWNVTDPSLSSFNLDHDEKYVIPFVKDAVAACPALSLFGSAWTAPPWMKTVVAWQQGELLKENYGVFAKYHAKWIGAMRKKGVPIWGLTVIIEPGANGRWEHCQITGVNEGHYIAEHLRPTLDAAGLRDVKIMFWDSERTAAKARAQQVLGVKGAKAAIFCQANHWYGGGHWDQVDWVHDTYGIDQITSEFCFSGLKAASGLPSWDHGMKYAVEFIDCLNHWGRAVVDWNVILDDKGGPNHFRPNDPCQAPIMIWEGKATKTTLWSTFYHISHYIERGATHIASSTANAALLVHAAENPDKSVIVVVLNEGAAVVAALEIGGQYVELELPAKSLQTIVLK
jgi:glucosylceramidase